MNELTQTPSISVDDRRLSTEQESISSRQVEVIGAKGLKNYKQLSETMSFNSNSAQVQRAQNNQTQISVKIEDQIHPEVVDQRMNQVKTSNSNSRNQSGIRSSVEVCESRVRKINNDLIMNSRQPTHVESSCRDMYAPK
jgi:hypothetical protein